jgi:hypothetical protein
MQDFILEAQVGLKNVNFALNSFFVLSLLLDKFYFSKKILPVRTLAHTQCRPDYD